MELNLKVYISICSPKTFTINGIEADYLDFGYKCDYDEASAPGYGTCGNMRFVPVPYTDRVLKKYGISETEYKEVCNRLSDKLSFGRCWWCS